MTFRWKDYKNGSKKRTMTLDAVEFLRRFMLHVLPRGLVRIRSFGFLANRYRKEKIQLCRSLLAPASPAVLDHAPKSDSALYICPRCHGGRMIVLERHTAQQVIFWRVGQQEYLDTS